MRQKVCGLSLGLVFIAASVLQAAGGTMMVASKGHKASISDAWPDGVGKIVNDSARTTGWNSWFTEWPNDVNQYALEISSTAEVNRLLEKLAAVKSDTCQVRLCHLAEPNSLGWVTRVPEGNGIPVVFSIGNQAQIDQWYARVRKPFGVMEFTATPVAVPPTLTLFVQHKAITLQELKIPEGVSVSMGYVPTVFHRSNTTLEQKKLLETKETHVKAVRKKMIESLEDADRKTAEEIDAFLTKQGQVQ